MSKEKKYINYFIYIQLLWCLFEDLFISFNQNLAIISIVPDIITIINIFLLIKILKTKKADFKLSLPMKIMIIFVFYVMLSFFWSNYNIISAISRLRYILSGITIFCVSKFYLTDNFFTKIVDTLFYANIINFVLVCYQSMIMNLHPDFCNGIFGFNNYNNASVGIFSLVVSILAILYFLDNKWCLSKSLITLGISSIICALAEIKIYFVLLIFSLVLVMIFYKMSKEVSIKLLKISGVVLLFFIIAYFILQKVLPDNLQTFFSISKYIEYESRSDYAGRFNTIPFIFNNLFNKNIFLSLFGTGLGSNYNNYIYELGKLFSECGFIGLTLFVIFLLSNIVGNLKGEKNLINQTFVIVFSFIVFISIIVWNCTFTRITYLVFFALSISNVKYIGDKNKTFTPIIKEKK